MRNHGGMKPYKSSLLPHTLYGPSADMTRYVYRDRYQAAVFYAYWSKPHTPHTSI